MRRLTKYRGYYLVATTHMFMNTWTIEDADDNVVEDGLSSSEEAMEFIDNVLGDAE